MQKASPPCQLAAEQRWLRGEMPRSLLAPRYNPSPQQIDAAKQTEKVLARRELASVLRMLEQHNRQRMLERHKTPFLLGPYLFQIIISVEQRRSVRSNAPYSRRARERSMRIFGRLPRKQESWPA